MTQNQRVLSMLKVAGKRGVRSDEFFKVGMPRGAARIKDLRDEGVPIESEREGKYVRYRLVGSSAGTETVCGGVAPYRPSAVHASAASSEHVARSVPSMFDADIEWTA